MATISLTDLNFFAHHGCFEAERTVGTHFRVNLAFDADTSKAERSDHIADTVSYLDVYQIIKREMLIPSNLLEYVARRTIDALKVEFPQISNIRISIQKLNPPLGGEVGAAVVSLCES
ncbi:MAG: dihydroneopterin aldolase [Bacteroidales bacterium]|jgi:dihydroneopterin aldolase|nr:dihydroneopterin aldolase [Bacteroidales bacterium]